MRLCRPGKPWAQLGDGREARVFHLGIAQALRHRIGEPIRPHIRQDHRWLVLVGFDPAPSDDERKDQRWDELKRVLDHLLDGQGDPDAHVDSLVSATEEQEPWASDLRQKLINAVEHLIALPEEKVSGPAREPLAAFLRRVGVSKDGGLPEVVGEQAPDSKSVLDVERVAATSTGGA